MEAYAIAKFVISKILGLNAFNLSLIMLMGARVTTEIENVSLGKKLIVKRIKNLDV